MVVGSNPGFAGPHVFHNPSNVYTITGWFVTQEVIIKMTWLSYTNHFHNQCKKLNNFKQVTPVTVIQTTRQWKMMDKMVDINWVISGSQSKQGTSLRRTQIVLSTALMKTWILVEVGLVLDFCQLRTKSKAYNTPLNIYFS